MRSWADKGEQPWARGEREERTLSGSESLGRKAGGKNNGNKHCKDKTEEWRVTSRR